MRLLVALLALAAALLGAAGASALLIERRVAALSPGGVTTGGLEYNAFSGRLTLSDVSARDADGREIFHAERVRATVNPLSVLGGALSLGRVRVDGPRLTLRATAGFDFDEVSQVLLGGSNPLALPLRVDDLVIGGGIVTIEGAGERGAPLVVRDLDLRVGRLTTATADGRDVAFAVEMAVYGTTVHVTGQPRGRGYLVHLRAKGLDAPALARDFPAAVLAGIERGEAEIDTDLVLSEGRVLASGFVRLTDAVVALPLAGRPRLRAASVAVAADAFDLVSGTGRLTRLDLAAPVLALPAARAGAALRAVLAPLRDESELVVRRISITDGTLALDGPSGVRLSRMQLAAHLPERRADSGWVVSARAVLDDDAEVSVDGLVGRDLRRLDAVTHLSGVPLARWRALAGATPGWDARVSFDGRLRLVASEGEVVATATGQAELSNVRGAPPGGFRAERVALGIRQLRWPSTEAVFDRVVVTRPAFGLAALAPWTDSLLTGEFSVVDGEVTTAPGRALHQVAVAAAPDDGGAGLVRLRVSAATESGARVSLDRIVAPTAARPGLPLGLLAATLEEAAHSATPAPATAFPSALPSIP